MSYNYKCTERKKVSPVGWEPGWAEAGPRWPCRCPPVEGRPESSGGLDSWKTWSRFSRWVFMVILHYVTVLLCADLTSPCTRLASPSAAVGNPGGSPKPADDSRLCISLMPGPLCPLAWRWRTLMASSRWSSILPAYRQQTEWMIEELHLPLRSTNIIMICCISHRRKNNIDTQTNHGLNSTLKVGWRCSLTRRPCPLGARAWKWSTGNIFTHLVLNIIMNWLPAYITSRGHIVVLCVSHLYRGMWEPF